MSGRTVRLGEVASIQLGKMLSPAAKLSKAQKPYLRNTNVQWGRIDLSDLSTMDFSPDERRKFNLLSGDVLVCEGGEPGRAAVWDDVRQDCYFQKALHRIRANPAVLHPEWLMYWFWDQSRTGAFIDKNAKTTIAHLPVVRLEALQIRLPAIEAQRKSAAELEHKLESSTAARASISYQLTDAAKLGNTLLERVFSELEHAPREPLSLRARTSSGTTPDRNRSDFWATGSIPWVKTGEIAFSPIATTEECVTPAALRQTSLALFPPGTVLVAMYGQGKTRGQSAVLKIEATCNQACFAIWPNDTWRPEFLQLWLQRNYRDLRALSESRGGNQANLNGALLNAFEAPVIPLDEQDRFVARVQAQMAELKQVQETLQAQRRDIDLLPSRLLAEAFA